LQYHRSYGIPTVATRSFSHTGPDQSPVFVFPSFARQIVAIERGENEPVLKVGNLSPVRDYLDVRDVIRAYRLLATAGQPGQVYNVSSGQPLTVQQGLEILLKGSRCQVEVQPDPDRQRPADIPYLVGDSGKLRRQTGWQPDRDIRATLHELLERARGDYS
jgi:GDP-4-dehydro-6-deoxy-D-mannose reductase